MSKIYLQLQIALAKNPRPAHDAEVGDKNEGSDAEARRVHVDLLHRLRDVSRNLNVLDSRRHVHLETLIFVDS